MILIIDRETLGALWRALEASPAAPRPHQAAEIGPAAAEAGWVAPLDLELVLRAQEPRLAGIRMQSLLDAFGVRRQCVHPRPTGHRASVAGVERIAAADAAHLLIHLERLGLAVDPAPFCAPLVPVLGARPYLTAAELVVFRYDRERHRMDTLTVSAGPDLPRRDPDAMLTTAAEYRVAMFRDAEGRTIALRTVASGRRRKHPDLSRAA